MTDDKDLLIEDHEYDGIQELDNHLPTWWLWTFLGAIIFSFLYWLHYDLSGDGWSLDQQLKADLAKIEKMRQESEKIQGGEEGESAEALLAMGKAEYMKNCSACHAPDGGGGVGPNLTDSYWIHGKGSFEEIQGLIEEGVAAKGMPPWKGIIKPKMIKAVTEFVVSLKGGKAANPKAPQGQIVE